MQEADKFFAKTARGMNSRYGSWPSNSVRKDLRDEMREFASERLQLVQVTFDFGSQYTRSTVDHACVADESDANG